ncbi:hypothetical protein [Hymenobacter sp. BT190]|uniref:hypothetical protein n=1 Tax=Hymenobacter sp. BT190 TaxID=2763505 RepID=UPI0016513D1D|nr:hypothetical protein [Hymenobacter sp. BT190]
MNSATYSGMNLRALDQKLPLHRDEARALHDALGLYHRHLTWLSGHRPLYLAETMSIRVTLRVHERLAKLLAGEWPRTRERHLKPRQWRVEFDELLQLNALLVEGTLFAAESSYESAFNCLYGKLNQKALNLTAHFRL